MCGIATTGPVHRARVLSSAQTGNVHAEPSAHRHTAGDSYSKTWDLFMRPVGQECPTHTSLLDLHQLVRSRRLCACSGRPLRIAPSIKDRNLVHARDGAVWRAGFFGEVFAADILDGVLLERNRGVAALLRAVVHQAILADVKISRPCAAAPLVRLA